MVLACVAVLSLALVPMAGPADAGKPAAAKSHSSTGEKLAGYDSRSSGPSARALQLRKAMLNAHASPAVKALRKHLGMQGIVDIDPITATPRIVAKVNGYLTGKSTHSPQKVALSYVRHHRGVFHLNRHEIGNLRLRHDYRDIAGTHHLSFVQTVRGIPAFGSGLRAHVDRHGRLIQVDGSPAGKLPSRMPAAKMSPTQARNAAVHAVFGRSKTHVVHTAKTAARATKFANGDSAKRVAFATRGGLRSGWQVIDMQNGWLSVIDDRTGRALFRQSLVESDSGQTWDNYPGAANGGTQRSRNLTSPGWLPNNSPRLAGNVAHVWKDVNDDNTAQASEEVPPSGRRASTIRSLRSAARTAHRASSAHGTPTHRTHGRRTPTRTPSRCSTSSASSTTTCGRTRSGSRARPGTSRQSTVTRSTAMPSTAPTSSAACPTDSTSTTRTC